MRACTRMESARWVWRGEATERTRRAPAVGRPGGPAAVLRCGSWRRGNTVRSSAQPVALSRRRSRHGSRRRGGAPASRLPTPCARGGGAHPTTMAPADAPATGVLADTIPSSSRSMPTTPRRNGIRKPPPLLCSKGRGRGADVGPGGGGVSELQMAGSWAGMTGSVRGGRGRESRGGGGAQLGWWMGKARGIHGGRPRQCRWAARRLRASCPKTRMSRAPPVLRSRGWQGPPPSASGAGACPRCACGHRAAAPESRSTNVGAPLGWGGRVGHQARRLSSR